MHLFIQCHYQSLAQEQHMEQKSFKGLYNVHKSPKSGGGGSSDANVRTFWCKETKGEGV